LIISWRNLFLLNEKVRARLRDCFSFLRKFLSNVRECFGTF
jgi:hypothetical protein